MINKDKFSNIDKNCKDFCCTKIENFSVTLGSNKILDNVQTRFGCRTFKIDPENGFILNGEEYPLRGVSRHQDRLGKGNAISKEDHEEDHNQRNRSCF